jgi:hypothetical protein
MPIVPPPDPGYPTASMTALGARMDKAGQLMLPLAIGAGVGFFLADRGMRLLPTMLQLSFTWVVIALVLIGAGRWIRIRAGDGGAEKTRWVVLALCLAALGIGAQLMLHRLDAPTALTGMTTAEFDATFSQDAARYVEIDKTLGRLLDRLSEQNLPPPGDDVMLLPAQERDLRQAWHSLLNQAIALDQIRRFHEDYWRYDPSRSERSYHLRSFLLTFAAELALYEKGLRFSALIEKNPSAKKLLDAPHPEIGLKAGSYRGFRRDLLGIRDQSRVAAGARYLALLRTGFQGPSEARALGVAWLWERCEQHLSTIEQLGALERAKLGLKADKDLLGRPLKRLLEPIKKRKERTMIWVGDAKMRRVGWYLINQTQQDEMDALLQPGDIMLSRKNWYLSNVALPGFWPHALLYLGAPDKFDAHFDDPDVTAWATGEAGRPSTLGQLLADRYPTAWLKYRAGQDGDPNRVIESISEGVVFNTMQHASGDYMAALRPRLSRVAKAQALFAAFSHVGKPYDFDFDFATDHALVCTELVWRAYRPGPGKAGLDLPVGTLMGRRTMPANDIVRTHDAQAGTEAQTMDFVLFYDGIEEQKLAIPSDEAALRLSWKRQKWDMAQR